MFIKIITNILRNSYLIARTPLFPEKKLIHKMANCKILQAPF